MVVISQKLDFVQAHYTQTPPSHDPSSTSSIPVKTVTFAVLCATRGEEGRRRFIHLHLFSLTSCSLTFDLSHSLRRNVHESHVAEETNRKSLTDMRERGGGSKGKVFDRIRAYLGSQSSLWADACCISESCSTSKLKKEVRGGHVDLEMRSKIRKKLELKWTDSEALHPQLLQYIHWLGFA